MPDQPPTASQRDGHASGSFFRRNRDLSGLTIWLLALDLAVWTTASLRVFHIGL